MSTIGTCPLPAQLRNTGVFVMPAGTIKRIHVNQHIIRSNKKTGARQPVVTTQWKNKSYTADEVKILGESRAVYSPDKPLSCGAHVWVETTATVELINQ